MYLYQMDLHLPSGNASSTNKRPPAPSSACAGVLRRSVRPGARFVVEVPVETLGQIHGLRHFESQAVHVSDEHQQTGQRLGVMPNSAACLIAFVVLYRRGQADYFGARRLRFQQKRRKVSAGNGWCTDPSTLPPLASTTAVVSFSNAWQTHSRRSEKTRYLRPA